MHFILNRDNPRVWHLWLLAFCYAVVISALIQFFVLPVVFPGFHAGHGLLKGFDSVGYHWIAEELTESMDKHGFTVWQLRPKGQGPGGIAALIYYFTVSEPWTLIPVNAGLHALSFVLVFLIVQKITHERTISAMAALPFLLFPSSLTWVTQIQKDTYSIPGLLLMLNCWLMAFGWAKRPTLKLTVLLLLSCLGSIFLLWSMRPYLLKFIQLFSVIYLVGCIGHSFVGKAEVFTRVRHVVLALLLTCTVIVIPRLINYTPEMPGFKITQINHQWHKNDLIPGLIDNQLRSIGKTREEFQTKYSGAKGNLDEEIKFNSSFDVISYIPRSLQIILFSPFPYQWIESGSSKATTLLRREAGVEMIASYFLLFFLPYAMWIWRKRISMWLTISFSILILVPYGLTAANIGTLFRMRYGPYMLLLSIGAAGLLKVIQIYRLNR